MNIDITSRYESSNSLAGPSHKRCSVICCLPQLCEKAERLRWLLNHGYWPEAASQAANREWSLVKQGPAMANAGKVFCRKK